MKYLAIKNWEKYQADKNGKVPNGAAPWCKLHTSIFTDADFLGWSWTERGVWLSLLALRSMAGQNLPCDPSKVVLMLGTPRKGKQDALRVIRERLSDGPLILTDQQNGALEESRGEEIRGEERRENTAQAPASSMVSEIDPIEGENMSAKSRIQAICRKRQLQLPNHNARVWSEISRRADDYGSINKLVDEFENFLAEDSSGSPVYAFARIDPPAGAAAPPPADHPELRPLVNAMVSHALKEIVFTAPQQAHIARMLQTNTADEILAAFKMFFDKRDETQLKYTARDWVAEGAEWVFTLMVIRREAAELKAQEARIAADLKAQEDNEAVKPMEF